MYLKDDVGFVVGYVLNGVVKVLLVKVYVIMVFGVMFGVFIVVKGGNLNIFEL